MQPWLEIMQLRKTIDDFQLGPIDLSFEPGTIHALIGKNGAGKSTLMKMLMNLVKKDEGQIRLFGQSIQNRDESWKQHISYLPQTLIGCNSFTGLELMKLTSHWYSTWDQKYFDQLVQMFDIPLRKLYRNLSQGVQKKLSITLTLACDTDILILDEPTAHMDIPSKQMLMDILVEWMERSEKLMIIASHQTDDIRKLADYLIVLKNGQLLGKFEKEELASRYKRYFLQQPLPNKPIPGEIGRKGKQIVITQQQENTEQYLIKHQYDWIKAESLELEEIITIMLNQPIYQKGS
ncbi:ABC transporter ATP-binding protein [Aeribacillus composti]|uniref:ABC transporter ATP-binding protein n=1 Tax=Aeribacillus composti TaxID=1868734 RepID=UPI002E218D65|nr:ABC transporter ATP-binding protein [Aeribacillus composti]